MSTSIALGLGSNIERETHLRAGVAALSRLLHAVRLSPVYDCDAVGFSGPSFFNMVVRGETDLPLAQLLSQLREIERDNGRAPNAERYSSRTLDIDLLVFGDLCLRNNQVNLPRGDILKQAYVLKPLSDIWPDGVHPVVGKTFAQLWRAFADKSVRLTPVQMLWVSGDVGGCAQ
ncbi:MAG: 2-amino-4-hydroxy-6-hydroxymethyldihydropteridine diphosphokinase [Gammaproteobacteria bacterium]|nr:MAG: 2-amino-4-hydroxy-6-hydroxymethyldihydropteridine diphosphokinase [Gammaproteobacteria bacterium]